MPSFSLADQLYMISRILEEAGNLKFLNRCEIISLFLKIYRREISDSRLRQGSHT